MRLLLLIALLLFATLTTGQANIIRHKIIAPAIVDPRKERVILTCEYDLNGKDLYAVGWYRNGDMLFKYSPTTQPRGLFFENQEEPDVRVDVDQSNSHRLVLLGQDDVHKNMRSYQGTYTCEVTTDQPFYSYFTMFNVTTAILPRSNLTIDGFAPSYNIGEQLDAICISAPSLPAADLKLFLNDEEIDESYIQHEQTQQAIGLATISSRLSVSLPLERHHFRGGNLKLSCRASLPGIPIRDYKIVKTATLGVRNQRLAQELPKLFGVSSNSQDHFYPLLILVIAPIFISVRC